MTTVTFLKKDDILAAVVRALAAKVSGYQVVSGMNDRVLLDKGFYTFDFDGIQHMKFTNYIEMYVPEKLQVLIKVEGDSKSSSVGY